jgi:hypothetical protein
MQPLWWEKAGWHKSGDEYTGHYRAGKFRLPGYAVFRSQWDCLFEVMIPHKLLAACGERRRCLVAEQTQAPKGWWWFEVHFSKRPETVSAGLIMVERMLSNAIRVALEGSR